jgi:DNA-binding MarR family transcriptional regulator/GNAT superfamily N-acetyltransferase
MRRTDKPTSGQIDSVREFNRFYTRQLGLLAKDYLSSEWSLSESRVLYELATRPEASAREIATHLRLDEAYLSRMLAKFERRKLIKRSRSSVDNRQWVITLTAAGRRAFAPLDDAAAGQISSQLATLPVVHQKSLLESMSRIKALLRGPGEAAGELRIRPLAIGDIGWITHRQAKLYADEFGWDITYEGLVAEILASFVKNFDARWDGAWIAEVNGQVMGSVFLVRAAETEGRLRLLYVEPSARGMGIGRKLVAQCLRGAHERGYRSIVLWTNDILASARKIYEAAGFQLVSQEPHRSFGKDLIGQTWRLELDAAASR